MSREIVFLGKISFYIHKFSVILSVIVNMKERNKILVLITIKLVHQMT